MAAAQEQDAEDAELEESAGPDPVRDMEPREGSSDRSRRVPTELRNRGNVSNTLFRVGDKPALIPVEPSAPQQLAVSQGDDVYLAKTAEELTGEGFKPDDLSSLAAGGSRTLTGATWVRTRSARHQAQAILLAPESAA